MVITLDVYNIFFMIFSAWQRQFCFSSTEYLFYQNIKFMVQKSPKKDGVL